MMLSMLVLPGTPFPLLLFGLGRAYSSLGITFSRQRDTDQNASFVINKADWKTVSCGQVGLQEPASLSSLVR